MYIITEYVNRKAPVIHDNYIIIICKNILKESLIFIIEMLFFSFRCARSTG